MSRASKLSQINEIDAGQGVNVEDLNFTDNNIVPVNTNADLVLSGNGTGVVVINSPVFNNRYLYLANSAGGQDISIGGTGVFANLTWDTQDRVDTLYSHSTVTNPEQITINVSGFYEISLEVTLEIPLGGGAEHTICDLRLIRDIGGLGAPTEIPTSRAGLTARSATVGQNSAVITKGISLLAGDVIVGQAARTSGGNTVTTVANSSRIKITLL